MITSNFDFMRLFEIGSFSKAFLSLSVIEPISLTWTITTLDSESKRLERPPSNVLDGMIKGLSYGRKRRWVESWSEGQFDVVPFTPTFNSCHQLLAEPAHFLKRSSHRCWPAGTWNGRDVRSPWAPISTEKPYSWRPHTCLQVDTREGAQNQWYRSKILSAYQHASRNTSSAERIKRANTRVPGIWLILRSISPWWCGFWGKRELHLQLNLQYNMLCYLA